MGRLTDRRRLKERCVTISTKANMLSATISNIKNRGISSPSIDTSRPSRAPYLT